MNQYFLSTRLFLCILGVGLATLLGSCGGGSDSGGSSETSGTAIGVTAGTMTKPQFIHAADKICAKTTEDVQRKGEEYARERPVGSTSEAAVGVQLRKFVTTALVPSFEKEIEQIASLGAPNGDGHKIAPMLEALQKGLDQAKADPENFFKAPNPSLAKAAQIGQAYGFERCGTLT